MKSIEYIIFKKMLKIKSDIYFSKKIACKDLQKIIIKF